MRPVLPALLLLLFLSSTALAQHSTDVVVTLDPLTMPESGTSTTLQATLHNNTAVSVDVDVDLVLQAAARTSITAAPYPGWPADQWSCTTLTPQHVRCRASIGPGPGQFIALMVTVDPVVEGRFALVAQARWVSGSATLTSEPYTQRLLIPREVHVRNTLDAGAGSLRDAIETLNGKCAEDEVPCNVLFRFEGPPPASGWYAIRPMTPLPAITSPDFAIDGERVGGDPHRIELDGSLLAVGHGLQLGGTGFAEVEGLAIGGFPWDGIAVTRANEEPAFTIIRDVYLGVRPDRSANGNGSRGITMDPPAAHVYLANSLIAANARSGVFIAGAWHVTVTQNFIGRGMVEGREFSNGASGVYVGPGSRDVVISTGYIEGNGHFGIAVARGASGVRLGGTLRIAGNALLPLDHGLDGFSGFVHENSGPATSRPPAPRILSVLYDPKTDTTTVSGTFDTPDPAKQWTVTIYSLAQAWPDLSLPRVPVIDGTFTHAFKGRPGADIEFSAYADCEDPFWSTSEFAEPVRLQEPGSDLHYVRARSVHLRHPDPPLPVQ